MRTRKKSNLLSLIGAEASTADRYLLIKHAGKSFGIEIDAIREIIRAVKIDPLPEAADETAGVINYRGEMIAVINFWKLLGETPPPPSPDMGIIVMDSFGKNFGLLIEHPENVVNLSVKPRPDELKGDVVWPLIKSVASSDEDKKTIMILNPEKLQRHPDVVESRREPTV